MDTNDVKLIEKVCNITGLFYPISTAIKRITDNKDSLRALQNEYDKSFREEILNRDMNDIAKAALISASSKSIKEFVNQATILGIAIENLGDSADPKNLDDDWLFFFMNKAATITDEQMRYTWGKILAEACEDPEICSKTLINTLSLISKWQAEAFQNICRFRMINMDIPANENKISTYPIIFLSKSFDGYAFNGITYKGISALEQLGLISIDSHKEFVVYTDLLKVRDYRNSVEVISNNKKVEIGNIIFTDDGYLLQKIIDPYYNVQIWLYKKYQVYVNGIKQNI